MTRFARAKGSKASNERLPEQPTPWHEMKRQLLEKNEESENWEKIQEIRKERQANYEAFLDEIETEKSRNETTKWAEFPEIGNIRKNNQKNGKLTKEPTKSLIKGALIEGVGKSLTVESKDGASTDNKNKSGENETIENLKREQSGNDNNKTKINKKKKNKKAIKGESQEEKETQIKIVDKKEENKTTQIELEEGGIKKVNKSEEEKKAPPKKKKNKRKPKPNDSKNEDLNKNKKENNEGKKEQTNKRKFEEEESETANSEGKKRPKKAKIDKTEAEKEPENPSMGKNSKPSKKSKTTKEEIRKNPQNKRKKFKELSETELKKVEKKRQKKLRQLERRKLRKLEQQTEKSSQETPKQNSSEPKSAAQNSEPKSLAQNSEPKSPVQNSHLKSLAQNTLNPVEGSNRNSSTKKPKKIRTKDNEALRRKPQQNSMNINGEEVEIAYFDGFPIKKSDFERLKQLKRKLIGKGLPRSEIGKTMKLERRRAEKMFAREKKKLCFNCRQSGHVLSECPNLNDTNQTELSGIDQTGVEICFKCGSTEHRQLDCRVVKGDSFRYATCFICKEQGHLSRQCPDNARGLYPNGGACHLCGDVTHLKKDCPKYLNQQQENSYYGGMVRSNQNPDGLDDDDVMGSGGVNKKINFNSKSVNKIIKF